jgi:hypothetical protein
MAELTFRSPGVSTREIDLTGPTAAQPSGIPAAVVGTANRGPAFVPVTVATFQDFVAVFGETDGEKFGPLAMREWLRNAGSAVYVRTLGAGDGRRRDATDGFVTRAGFVVGEEQVQADGIVGPNTYADGGLVTLGRTYFLGAYMSESAGSTVFSSAGLVTNTGQAVTASVPIIRGVVMAPSGVALSLGTTAGEAAGTTAISGTATGSVNLASNSEFAVLLNGHVSTARYKNVITASFDPTAPNYFSQVFNTNPDELEAAGHYLYSHYDIWPAEAVVTGTGVVAETASKANIAFVLTGTTDHNSGSDVLPDYEEFRDRYRAAFSPWFISQAFGGKPKNLFKVHALTDGASESSRFKVSISNIAPSTSEADQYGHFDLLVRDFGDTDTDPVVLERFSRLSLNPASDRYAPRVVGDRYVYFDWDKKEGDQRIIIEGSYPNSSRFVRLEMADEVDEASIDPTALPVGFRGHHHLLTSGSYAAWTAVGDNFLEVPQLQAGVDLAPDANYLARANQPPVPMRLNINVSSGLRAAASNRFYWGTQFEVVDDLDLRNKNTKRNRSIDSFTKYFPLYHTSELNPFVGDNAGVQDGGTVFDSDRYNNNLFTLERIAVRTGSNGAVDVTKWVSATYARDAVNPGGDRRFLTVADDFGSLPNRSYIKFSTFVQAGFDGLNAFNEDKREMTNNAIIREFGDSAQGESDGPTIRSYRKAIEILGAQANADIQLLAIPGIRHQIVTDFAIDEVEDRFDAFYIMDVSEYDNTRASTRRSRLTTRLTSSRRVTSTPASRLRTSPTSSSRTRPRRRASWCPRRWRCSVPSR